jgi:hypothetical protein
LENGKKLPVNLHRLGIVLAGLAAATHSACVNDPQRAIEIAAVTCMQDWASYGDQTESEKDGPTSAAGLKFWHARPDGNGWLVWAGIDEKEPAVTVHVSKFGPFHSNCYRFFPD